MLIKKKNCYYYANGEPVIINPDRLSSDGKGSNTRYWLQQDDGQHVQVFSKNQIKNKTTYYDAEGNEVIILPVSDHHLSYEGTGNGAKHWLRQEDGQYVQVFTQSQIDNKTTYYDAKGTVVITVPTSDNRLFHEGSDNSAKHWLWQDHGQQVQVFTRSQIDNKTTYYDAEGNEVITAPVSDNRLFHEGSGKAKHWLQREDGQQMQVFTQNQIDNKTTYYDTAGNAVITVPTSDNRLFHEGSGRSAKHWLQQEDGQQRQVFTQSQINHKTTYYDAEGNVVITVPTSDNRIFHKGNGKGAKHWLQQEDGQQLQVFTQKNDKKRKREIGNNFPSLNYKKKKIQEQYPDHLLAESHDTFHPWLLLDDVQEMRRPESTLLSEMNDTASNLSDLSDHQFIATHPRTTGINNEVESFTQDSLDPIVEPHTTSHPWLLDDEQEMRWLNSILLPEAVLPNPSFFNSPSAFFSSAPFSSSTIEEAFSMAPLKYRGEN